MIEGRKKTCKANFNLRSLRLSLKYRPEILKLILKMRQCIRKKSSLIIKLKHRLKEMGKAKESQNNNGKGDCIADENTPVAVQETTETSEPAATSKKKENKKQQKTKDNSMQTNEITEKSTSTETTKELSMNVEESGWKIDEENVTKSIAEQVKEAAQDAIQESGMVYVESAGMYYDYKTGYYYNSELGLYYHTDTECYYYYSDEKKEFVFHSYPDRSAANAQAALLAHERRKARKQKMARKAEEEIDNLTKNLSQVSLRGQTALDSIAKHHPPCMRVIVRETSLPKLRVGSLFIVTKDGGTVGREGEQHTILLRDTNVSRNHLEIRYDISQCSYVATDLGSKNGSLLNGSRMSESQIISEPMAIVHGSTLQLGETKLLCHIHPGNDTCGHCEPGLLIEALEKEKKVAYTRTCSVKKQHELELARLKNKYGAKPMLAIEATAYNDRAQIRRETVGSSHHAEKTQVSDISESIAPDNKGFKLLEKMGWNKGEGLGKDSQGDTEPVPLISNEGKTGLGAVPVPLNPANTLGPATLRLAARTKMLQPPAKAFQNILDDDYE